MEAFRHLMTYRHKIVSLHRMSSYRLSFSAKNSVIGCRKSELYRTFAYYRPQASPLSTRSHHVRSQLDGNQGLKNVINGKTFHNYVRSSDYLTKLPRTFSVPQNNKIWSVNIHASARRNVILPPHIWLFIKPVQKLMAIILGRSVRNWWRDLPANKRQLFKESVKRNKWKLSLSGAALGFTFILFYFTNLEETPITGRSRLLVFRKEHYDLLTTMEYENLIEEFKDTMLPSEDARYQLVQEIVNHLIACNSDLPEVARMEWAIHVVDKPVVNAFVLPNGQVFVFTGMLDAVADVHQLSFILGHELAHAILEHTAEKASVTHFLDFLFLISLAVIWAICPMDSLAMVGQWVQSKLREFTFERPFSRSLEAEADKVGLELAAKACVDVRASSVFWKQMEVTETLGGQPRVPEWFSTHPSHENRAEHLDRLIPKAIKLRESCNCSDLPAVDPRLVFDLSVKRLLQNQKDREAQAMKGDVLAVQMDHRVPVTSAVKAA